MKLHSFPKDIRTGKMHAKLFKKHSNSECHKEAVESVGLPVKTGDVGEMPSTEHRKEKSANRTIVPTL